MIHLACEGLGRSPEGQHGNSRAAPIPPLSGGIGAGGPHFISLA